MPAEQLTNITISAKAQSFIDAMTSATTAATQFENATARLGNSTTKTQEQVTVTAASFAKLRSSLDQTVRSAEQFAKAENQINAALAVNLTNQAEANKLLDLANEKYRTVAYQAEQAAKAQAEAAQKAAQQQADSVLKAQQQIQAAQQRTLDQAVTQYRAMAAAASPAVKAAQELAEQQRILNTLVAGGKMTQPQATQALQDFKDAPALAAEKQAQADISKEIANQAKSYEAQLAALYPLVAKEKELADFRKSVNFAVSQGIIEPGQGATQVADFQAKQNSAETKKAAADAKAATDAQTKSVQQASAAYKQMMAAIDPVIEREQDLAKFQASLNTLMNAGQISAVAAASSLQKFQAAQKDAEEKSNKLKNSLGLTGYQAVVIGQQFRQLTDQMIAGGGFWRPFLMQAPVVIENMRGIGGATSGLGGALNLLKNNIGLIAGIGGLGAIGVALTLMGVAAERNQRSINSLSTGLQKYGGDFQANANLINAAAKEMAATTSIGTQEARDAMATLASAPGFVMTRDNLQKTAKAAQDLGASMGTSTEDAAKRIKEIFADPVAAALKGLQENLAGFDNNFVATIRDMVNSGHEADAINAVFHKLTDNLRGASDRGTEMQIAWRKLTETLTQAGNAAGGAGDNIGTGLTHAVAGAIDDVTILIKWLGDTATAFEKVGISGKTQLEIVGTVLALQLLPGIRNVEAALVRMAAVQFVGLIGGLGGVATALGGVATAAGTILAPLAALAAIVTTFKLDQSAKKSMDDTATQLGYTKQGGSLWNPYTKIPTYTSPTGETLSFTQMQTKTNAFNAAPTIAIPPPAGAASNLVSTVQGYTGQTGAQLNSWLNDNGAQLDAAKNAWCAAFVNSALKSVGIQGTGSNLASSFSQFSTERPINQATGGDIIVQPPQAAGASGHVGVFTGNKKVDENGQVILEMTSGNYGGKVATSWVPQSQISSLRALPTATPAAGAVTATGPATEKSAEAIRQERLAQMPNTMDEQRRLLQAQLDETNKLIDSGTLAGDALDKEKQHAEDLAGQLYKLVPPITTITRQQQNQLAVENQLDPVQQKVTEALQSYDEAMKQLGRTPDPAEREQIRIGVLQQLGAQYRQTVNAAEQSANSEGRVADAWEKGAAAANHATNAEKARQQVAGNSPTISTAQAAAIELVTKALDKQTDAANRAAVSQMKHQDESQNRLLDVQEATLGASAKLQAETMAAAQQREQLKLAGREDTPGAKELIDKAGKTAARTVDVEREKAAWQDVDQAASQAVDDIGQGLETVLSGGQWSDFANAGKKALQDISNEFIKMALLNPIKNLLGIGGSNTGTLFDLFKGGAGVAGAASSGGGGLLGWLFGSGSAATGAIGGAAALHEGGIAGYDGTPRFMPIRVFANAPRFHSGFNAMSPLPQIAHDEIPAILQRNEMVLTQAQQRFVAAKMRTGTDRPIVINPQITVHTPDADSFRKSKNQITTEVARSLAVAAKRM